MGFTGPGICIHPDTTEEQIREFLISFPTFFLSHSLPLMLGPGDYVYLGLCMNISIPINRKRFPSAVVAYLLATILFVFNLFYRWDALGGGSPGPTDWLIRIIPIGFALFMTIISLADYIKTLFDKNASLSISERGIDDNLSLFSCREIAWNEILGAEVIKVFRTDMLIIHILDREKHIARQKPITRMVLKKFIRKWGSPVVISAKRIDYDLQELKEVIEGRVK